MNLFQLLKKSFDIKEMKRITSDRHAEAPGKGVTPAAQIKPIPNKEHVRADTQTHMNFRYEIGKSEDGLEKAEQPPRKHGEKHPSKPYVADWLDRGTKTLGWKYNPEEAKRYDDEIAAKKEDFIASHPPEHQPLIRQFLESTAKDFRRHFVPRTNSPDSQVDVPRARHIRGLINGDPNYKLSVHNPKQLSLFVEKRHGEDERSSIFHFPPKEIKKSSVSIGGGKSHETQAGRPHPGYGQKENLIALLQKYGKKKGLLEHDATGVRGASQYVRPEGHSRQSGGGSKASGALPAGDLSRHPSPWHARNRMASERQLSNLKKSSEKPLPPITVNRDYEVPYLAESSIDGNTVYIDRRFPSVMKLKDGRNVDVAKFIAIHEVVEKALMDRLGFPYKEAHHMAIQAERKAVEDAGINWSEYDNYCMKYVHTTAKKYNEIPKDVWLKPERDNHDYHMMEKLRHAKDAPEVLDLKAMAKSIYESKFLRKSYSYHPVTPPERLSTSEGQHVAAIAVISGNKLLMGKRRDNGRWTNPGGHLEAGEKPLEGAKRELFEEAGIKAPASAFRYLGSENVTTDTGKKKLIHAFVIHGHFKTTSKNDPDEEVARWEYVDCTNGVPKDIAANLHSPKNVLLKKLKLL